MNADGSNQTRLTDAPGDESSPDWSSDGTAVVYETTDAGGTRQLAIVAVGYNSEADHGSGFAVESPRFITAGTDSHGAPSWRGDGVIPAPDPDAQQPEPNAPVETSSIVHTVTAFGTTYLDFIQTHPTKTTTGPLFAPASVPAPLRYQLTGDPGGDLAPNWHPHGDGVVFASDRGQAGNRDIYRIDTDGTNLARLTQDPGADQDPDWESIGSGCLTPEPYAPRPGRQMRGPRPGPPPTGSGPQTPSGSTPPGKGATSLRIANLRVTKGGRGSRRFIVVRFVVNRPARGSLRALRGRRVVARRLNRPLAAGNARIRLNVPRTVRGGRHRLRLTVSSGATTLTFHRNARIRSLRTRR